MADMKVPDDLRVDVRQGFLYLSSGNRTITISHRIVFENGPMAWTDFVFRHLAPALYHLNETESAK